MPCTAAMCDEYTRETDHLILHVILTLLHQENGRSFLDHLPNGGSHFEDVGWA